MVDAVRQTLHEHISNSQQCRLLFPKKWICVTELIKDYAYCEFTLNTSFIHFDAVLQLPFERIPS